MRWFKRGNEQTMRRRPSLFFFFGLAPLFAVRLDSNTAMQSGGGGGDRSKKGKK
jgi:hypothetical protein